MKDKLTLSDGTQVSIEKIEIEKLETPETKYNFEVEDFHTYYVTDSDVLVHNLCRKGWDKERRRYWKEQGLKYKDSVNAETLSDSKKYYLTKDNIDRMLKGKAPIGTDMKSVNLHHVKGFKVDPFDYVEVTRTEHYSHFKELHPWLFKK